MRSLTALTLCLLLIVGSAAADEQAKERPAAPLTTAEAADAVLQALESENHEKLKAVAGGIRPDVWLVADELLARRLPQAAASFAEAVPGKGGTSLVAYIAARRGEEDEGEARKAFAAAEAALRANRADEALALVDEAELPAGTIVTVRLGAARAQALRGLKRLKESSEAFLAAAASAEQLGWSGAQATMLREAGISSAYQGDLPGALAAWERALPLIEARGEIVPLRQVVGGIGVIHDRLGASRKALPFLERAIGLAERIGNKADLAQLSNQVGQVHRKLGTPAKALPHLERAMALEAELGNTAKQAMRMTDVGAVKLVLGDLPEAQTLNQRALFLFEQVGDKNGMSVALTNLGHVHLQLGDPVTALPFQKRALALAQELGDEFGVAATRISIGNIHLRFGDYVKAMRQYSKAMDAFRKQRYKPGVATALGGIGSAQELLGHYANALANQERALRLFDELGDKAGVAATLSNLGNIHDSLGDHERARAHLARSLAIYEETENRPGVAHQLANLGSAQESAGNYEEALTLFERALVIQREILDKPGVAQVFENIGSVHAHLGNHARALGYLDRALVLWEQMKDRGRVAGTLAFIGETQARMGKPAEGLETLARAVREARSRRIRPLLVRCLSARGRIYMELGQTDRALAEAQQALAEVEHLLGRLGETQGALARARYTEVFEVGAAAAARADDLALTVTFLESNRAGSLLESLGGRSSLRWEDLPESLRRAESVAAAGEARAREAYRKASESGDRKAVRETAQALADAATRTTEVAARIQREVKGQARVFFYPRAAAVEEIQEHLRGHEALVLYGFCLDEVLAVVLTPSKQRVVSLGAAVALSTACADLDLTDRDVNAKAQLAKLRKLIVEPLSLGPEVTQVLVSPEGPLSYVPFAALFDRAVALTPSGTTHVMLRDVGSVPGRDVLALGDPDYSGVAEDARAVYVRGRKLTPLPSTRLEAEAIGDEVLLGLKCTEADLRTVLGKRKRWRAVHFACHGLVDRERPTLSSLALSASSQADGFLTALEVLRMNIPADLVVLSACETGRGQVVKGEGIVGLTRAFMYAGAPRVICSLWKVDDAATRALMIKFYELWNPKQGEGLGAAAALRKAQAFVRDQEQWKQPYYWAAWVLWGLPD